MGELECGSCGERFPEGARRYKIIHTGNLFDEVLDVCEKCKLENLKAEIKDLTLCTTCTYDCFNQAEKYLEGKDGIILITKCDLFTDIG